MPATAFVYQYFLYNSIYQYDWSESIKQLTLVPNDYRKGEANQQDKLERYLCSRDGQGAELRHAFQPFSMHEIQGNWTAIIPGGKITKEMGKEFFERMQEIQNLVVRGIAKKDLKRLFQNLTTCRSFVYQVRNNIFHGSKNLEDLENDPDHKRRIVVYYLFLHCLVSWFFRVMTDCNPEEPVNASCPPPLLSPP